MSNSVPFRALNGKESTYHFRSSQMHQTDIFLIPSHSCHFFSGILGKAFCPTQSLYLARRHTAQGSNTLIQSFLRRPFARNKKPSIFSVRAMADNDGANDEQAAKERAAAEEAARWQQMALRMQQQRAGASNPPAATPVPTQSASDSKASLGVSDLSNLEGKVRPASRNNFALFSGHAETTGAPEIKIPTRPRHAAAI